MKEKICQPILSPPISLKTKMKSKTYLIRCRRNCRNSRMKMNTKIISKMIIIRKMIKIIKKLKMIVIIRKHPHSIMEH